MGNISNVKGIVNVLFKVLVGKLIVIVYIKGIDVYLVSFLLVLVVIVCIDRRIVMI